MNKQKNLIINSVSLFVFSLLIILYSLFAGKSMSWDVANHHVYIPFAWITGKVTTDLLGAGPQSYQNPLGYFPFYFMLMADWKDWVIGIVLSIIHSLNIWFVWLLAKKMWQNQLHHKSWPWIAAVFSLLTPVFLQMAGTSYNDPIGSIFVVFAIYILIAQLEEKESRKKIIAYMLAGIALSISFSIKQSNAVFIIAIGIMLAYQWINRWISWKNILYIMMGGIVGLVLGMGWYSWILWNKFGNPVFPLFNSIFKSPYYPTTNSVLERFVPQSFSDFLLFPLTMLKNKPWVYIEVTSPDFKLALFLILAAIALVFILFKKIIKKNNGLVENNNWRKFDSSLLILMLSMHALWLITSGNGRYAIPLLLLTGLGAARLFYLLLPTSLSKITVGVLIVVQSVILFSGMKPRLGDSPWTGRTYFDVEIDKELTTKPSLNLFIGKPSFSIIAPYLHPDSAFSNPIGQYNILPEDNMLGKEFSNLLKQWEGNTRIILSLGEKLNAEQIKTTYYEGIKRKLYPLGLTINLNDCKYIDISHDSAANNWLGYYNLFIKDISKDISKDTKHFISCAAIPQEKNSLIDEQLKTVKTIVAKLEQQCPEIYTNLLTTFESTIDNIWHVGLENKYSFVMSINLEKEMVTVRYDRGLAPINLGTASEIEKNGSPLSCKEQHYSVISADLLDKSKEHSSSSSIATSENNLIEPEIKTELK